MRMRAITLWQPWATLIAIGAKQIETRSWATDYRGPIAIHAGKRFPREAQYLCLDQPFARVLTEAGHPEPELTLPRGAVVAVANLVSCTPVEELCVSDQENAFGNYGAGRYGWVLENVRRLEIPIPVKGAQGLWWWDVPEDCEVQL